MADQLAQAVGLPDVFLSDGEGGGVIQGSASDSTLVALLTARTRALTYMRRVNPGVGDHELMAKMTLYASDQVSEPTQKRGAPLAPRPLRARDTFNRSDFLAVMIFSGRTLCASVCRCAWWQGTMGMLSMLPCEERGSWSSVVCAVRARCGLVASSLDIWFDRRNQVRLDSRTLLPGRR